MVVLGSYRLAQSLPAIQLSSTDSTPQVCLSHQQAHQHHLLSNLRYLQPIQLLTHCPSACVSHPSENAEGHMVRHMLISVSVQFVCLDLVPNPCRYSTQCVTPCTASRASASPSCPTKNQGHNILVTSGVARGTASLGRLGGTQCHPGPNHHHLLYRRGLASYFMHNNLQMFDLGATCQVQKASTQDSMRTTSLI